ncbi:hypothetical protein [Streptomyces sp. NPDC048172]|uniref:hypothetical protein n=1 Tax=Streptomyces sp. NPDC048172 TaxID=3365505 RepID=UPI0037185787
MSEIEGVHQDGPYQRVVDVQDAARQLSSILERVRDTGEDFLITDGQGKTLGLLVNAEIFEELGEFLALAENTHARMQGSKGTPHDDFAREMGIEPRQDRGDAA